MDVCRPCSAVLAFVIETQGGLPIRGAQGILGLARFPPLARADATTQATLVCTTFEVAPLDLAGNCGCFPFVGTPHSIVRFFRIAAVAMAIFLCGNAVAGRPVEAVPAAADAAVERLELLGFPLGADAFARAVATKHRPIIDLCFSAQLDVNAPDEKGHTPLQLSTLHGDWETVRRLMNAGAAVDAADAAGVTPLMAAAMHGNVEMLRAFTERKAGAEAVDAQGRAALHYAIAAAKLEAIEFLLPLTTNSGATCADGNNALGMAYETQDAKILQTVLEHTPAMADWNTATRAALTDALGTGEKDRIRLLLGKHAAPPNPEGHTAPLLAYAISMNQTPLFDMLLECGADPNTAIPSPCEKDFLATVPRNFLHHYLEGDSGVTVLMLAASLGKEDTVKALLAAGANRNRATPKFKMIALYFATRSDSWLCSQMLIGSGPSPDKLRIEVSLSSQEAVVFKNGTPTFKTSVSTGRKGFSTPPGRYVITDKDRDHHSTIYKVAMPFFMRLSCRDFGLHQGVVESHPASHGCIRLPGDAARKLFSEIPVGTLVSID